MLINKNKKYNDIIAWHNDGKAFIILNENEFRKILHQYFRAKDYLTFIR